MYLVELRPGMEAIYRSLADLTAAIRRGEVGAQARIFHRGKSMWAPITVHPVYRKLTATMASGRPSSPLRREWTFLPAEAAEETAPASASPAESGPAASLDRTRGPARARRWRGVLGGLLGRRAG